jgi:hypothetical protein
MTSGGTAGSSSSAGSGGSGGVNKLWDDEAAKVDVLLKNPVLLAEIESLRVIDGCRK